MSKNVLMIVGSLRQQSFNRQLAEKAAALLQEQAQVSFLYYADIPYMNQDIEFPTPQAVARVRGQVQQADAIWIVTPEYNHSYPGVLKNLIDWLSRPLSATDPQAGTAIAGKKIIISGAGGKFATQGARTDLKALLDFVRADVLDVPQTGIALDGKAFQSNFLTLTPEAQATLQQQATALLQALE